MLSCGAFESGSRVGPILCPRKRHCTKGRVIRDGGSGFMANTGGCLGSVSVGTVLDRLVVSRSKRGILGLSSFLRGNKILLVGATLNRLRRLSLLFNRFFVHRFRDTMFQHPGSNTRVKDSRGGEVCGQVPVFFGISRFPLCVGRTFRHVLALKHSCGINSLVTVRSLNRLRAMVGKCERAVVAGTSSGAIFKHKIISSGGVFSRAFLRSGFMRRSLGRSAAPIAVRGRR